MTFNGAIAELVILREHSMMPEIFKSSLDKIIETVSECEEPSVSTDIIHCRDCVWYLKDQNCARHMKPFKPDGFCSEAAERRTDGTEQP